MPTPTLTAIVPCNDLDISEAFYARLGFVAPAPHEHDDYRILADDKGGNLHLTKAVAGWVVPGRNPFGLYLYTPDVDAVATRFAGDIEKEGASHKPWGMYEFALSDPDGVLVRVGWPSRLMD